MVLQCVSFCQDFICLASAALLAPCVKHSLEPFTPFLAHAMLFLAPCSVKNIMGPGRRGSDRRSLKVSEARPLIEEAATEPLVSSDSVRTGDSLLCPVTMILRLRQLNIWLLELGAAATQSLTQCTGLDEMLQTVAGDENRPASTCLPGDLQGAAAESGWPEPARCLSCHLWCCMRKCRQLVACLRIDVQTAAPHFPPCSSPGAKLYACLRIQRKAFRQ